MESEEKSPNLFDSLLLPKIFQTFKLAVRPSKLIIAFLAVAVICLAGYVMDFSKTVVTAANGDTELQVYLSDSVRVQQFIAANSETQKGRGVFSTLWQFGAEKFHGILISLSDLDIPAVKANVNEYIKALAWAFKHHTAYCIIFGVIKLAVIALAGGAVCRIAALEFARDEKPGITEALTFGRKNFFNFFAAPLFPAVLIILVGLFIVILGVICNLWWFGELITGICLPFALIGGALISVVLIGTIAGFGLMFPAVAYDGSDFFDAMGRAWHYVFKKPWWMVFYIATAAVYGAVCYMFVRFFVFLTLLVAHKSLQIGVWTESTSGQADKLRAIWPEPNFMDLAGSLAVTQTNLSESTAAFIVNLYLLAVIGLVVSFIISFYFSANTIIYAILRNKVDGTGLDDIYTALDETEPEPTIDEPVSEETNSRPQNETKTQ